MEIKHEETESKGAFYIEIDGVRKAEMTYSKAGSDRIIIDHTEVKDDLRGTGAGKKLVLAAVEMVRAKNIKIVPLCPFAKSVFQREPDLRDVL